MTTNQTIIEIWRNLSKKRKLQVYSILIFIIFVSICEVASILLIGPLLQIIFHEEINTNLKNSLDNIIRMTEINNIQIRYLLGSGFLMVYIAASIGRLILSYWQTRLGYFIGSDIGSNIYKKYLAISYDKFIEINSSDAISLLSVKVGQLVHGTVTPLINSLSSIISIILIILSLMYVDASSTMYAFILIIIPYASLYFIARKIMNRQGVLLNESLSKQIKIITESFRGIKNIKIDGTHDFYIEKFNNVQKIIGKTSSILNFSTMAPKYLIESIMVLVIAYFIVINTEGNVVKPGMVTLLGVFVLAVQRLMPMLQSVYYSLASLKGSAASVQDIGKELLREIDYDFKNIAITGINSKVNPRDCNMNTILELNEVKYIYPKNIKPTFEKINLKIKIGEKVAIVGDSGSGKSTLINVIAGLFKPVDGNVFFYTPQAAKPIIAYVSNENYISDSSAYSNIGLGLDENLIDKNEAVRVANISNIHSRISSFENGYESILGESGVLLSSGEKQRLAIARALYKKPDILILDEGTSALDENNEKLILEKINSIYPRLSIILVTHNEKNLKYCDRVIRLSGDGTICEIKMEKLNDIK